MIHPEKSPATAEAVAEPARASARAGVSARALLIGVLLIPFNILWVVHVEYVKYSDNVSTSALFFNCIFLLLVLLLGNYLLSRVSRKHTLSRGEILTVYVMLVVATGLCGHDQMQILFTVIHYAVERATPDNGWLTTIIPNLPRHLVPPPGDAVHDLYRGGSSLYTPSHYLPWIAPLAWWTVFVVAVVWVSICLSSIFRRQWEAERLTYPIAEIPLAITDPKERILANPYFWGAFALAAGLRFLVVAHLLVPTIPEVAINTRYIPLSTSPPWNAAGAVPISFFPFVIGMSYFVPAQVGFSLWFFVLLGRVELVGAAMFGEATRTGFPYQSEQGAGAALGLAIAIIWFARKHLRNVWSAAWGRLDMDDADEPLPYATAFWGLVAGCVFIGGFAIKAGLSPIAVLIFLPVLLLVVLMAARLRVEVGLPTFELYGVGGDSLMRTVMGDSHWTARHHVVMPLFFWLTRTNRQFPMSGQMDAFQMSKRSDVSLRGMTGAIMLASVVSIVVAFWAFLHVMYKVGYGSANYSSIVLWAFGSDPWTKAHSHISSPQLPDTGRTGAYIFGLIFALFLGLMRGRFIWWPFHPAGYVASTSLGVGRIWVPIFIAWMAKTLILRYGGLKGYKKAAPFFIGLIAGEFVMGMLVTLLGLCGIDFPQQSGIGGL